MVQYVTVRGNNQWKKFLLQKKNHNNPPKSENIEIETGWWQPLQNWRSTKQKLMFMKSFLFDSLPRALKVKHNTNECFIKVDLTNTKKKPVMLTFQSNSQLI